MSINVSKNGLVSDKTVHEVYGHEQAGVFNDLDQKVITSGHTHSEEVELYYPDGYTRTVLSTRFPVISAKGDVIGLGTTNIDLTEHKRTEEALKKSETRLMEIIAIVPEAVITIGEDMNIQMFNEGAERIFGYKAAEVLGRSIELLIPECLRRNHQKYITEFSSSLDTYRLMDKRDEIMGLRNDGEKFPASASVSRLKIGDETIFTVVLHDISIRRQVEESRRNALMEAEIANQAKSEFLATMSHELRTPLNAISGFSSILTSEIFGEIGHPKYKEYADDIHTSSNHLLHLINKILDLSTIEAGKHTLNKELLTVKHVVVDCSPIIAASVNNKNITYTVDVPKDIKPLCADRRAVKQILINILDNAVKFTSAEGWIKIIVSTSDNHHVIEVIDSGVGISESMLPNITDSFVRAENNPYKTQEGTGLGLAIVKSLVELHEGKLKIMSTIGEGTRVVVSLPSGTL